jgi:hypothetical protein
MTYIVLYEVFDTPPITARELHDFSLQAALVGIARHGLVSNPGRGLVISTNPGRKARIGHLSGDIGIYGSDKLVMVMVFVSRGRCEDGIYKLAELGLIKAAWTVQSMLASGDGIR